MFDSWYVPYASERAAFGVNWTDPQIYKYGEYIGCALYIRPEKSDGQSVEVSCCAMPARFYKLNVLPGATSVGEERPGYVVTFGSGQAEIAAQIANAIREGMLTFRPQDSEDKKHG
jgi:hypothetical protein